MAADLPPIKVQGNIIDSILFRTKNKSADVLKSEAACHLVCRHFVYGHLVNYQSHLVINKSFIPQLLFGLKCFIYFTFRTIGFFNEADTLESSSILIYSELQTGLYTQWVYRGSRLN